MLRPKLGAVVVALLLPLAVGACSQKSSGPISKDDLAKSLQDNGQSKDFAKCVANQMWNTKDPKLKLTTADKKAFNKNDPSKQVAEKVYELAAKAGPVCRQKGLKP